MTKSSEKYKKCPALSRSSEPAEAAAALRQAQKLMEIYGIKQTDLVAADIGLGFRPAVALAAEPYTSVDVVAPASFHENWAKELSAFTTRNPGNVLFTTERRADPTLRNTGMLIVESVDFSSLTVSLIAKSLNQYSKIVVRDIRARDSAYTRLRALGFTLVTMLYSDPDLGLED